MTLHAEDRDQSVDPGTDFYRFANGGWMDAHAIPAGFGAWGSFEEVLTRNEVVLRSELERAGNDPHDDLERRLGDFYASGMDTVAIETAGLAPVQHLLDAVAAVDTPGAFLDLHAPFLREGLPLLYAAGATVDHEDSSRYLLWVLPSGLGLPDRDSYFADSEAAVALRAAYVDHVAAQLTNSGTEASEAAALAPRVLELETRLAEPQLKAEERRDRGRTLNKHSLGELAALAPELGLPGYVAAIGAAHVLAVNVSEPAYLEALHAIVAATDVAVLRAYAVFHVIAATASTLPVAFEDEAFEFYGRRVEGKQEPKDRWKRVVAAIGSDMGEALSQLFVRATFSEAAKDRAEAMVGEILAEMRHSLQTRDWMSEQTRAKALTKLDSFGVKIGYPDEWRSWDGLEIDRRSYAANRIAASRFDLARQMRKLDESVDAGEWDMPPHIVNAYYHPVRNEIVFPAGILQEPFFDAEADDAVNYGGIGTVIAHEVTHGFDDQGRRFDADGAFRDWWTEDDQAHFTGLAERLVAQFDEYVAVGEVHVNGRLTLGENIADLGGIALAQRAHARVSEGAADIDGLSPAQRFFLANAAVWRGNVSEELARTLAQVDPHSPRRARVHGPVSNSDAFQAAFALADDAPILRPRADRIEIW
jgi:predicted metalloendopeptidase